MLRTPLAGLFGLLAVVLLPLAVVAVWWHTVVSDTDAYLQRVGPLAADPAVRSAVEEAVTRTLLDQPELDALVSQLGSLAGEEVAAGLVRGAVHEVVAGSAFPSVWSEAHRSGHRQVMAILQGRVEPDTAGGQVVIDLDEVIDPVLESLATRGLPTGLQLPPVDVPVPLLPAADLQLVRTAHQLLESARVWAPVVTGAVGLLALLAARRRARALAWLAGGAAVALLLTAAGVGLARSGVVSAAGSRAHEVIAGAITEALTADLWRGALVGAGLCVLVAVLAAVGAVAAGARLRR